MIANESDPRAAIGQNVKVSLSDVTFLDQESLFTNGHGGLLRFIPCECEVIRRIEAGRLFPLECISQPS